MTRRQLAARLAEKTGLSARRADQVLQVLPSLVAGELTRAGRLEWRSLGTFAVRHYPPRQIHVPATGQTTTIPARAGVTFKPSRKLIVAVSPPPSRTRKPSFARRRPRR
jgi:nucleoid DNA-binding protein